MDDDDNELTITSRQAINFGFCFALGASLVVVFWVVVFLGCNYVVGRSVQEKRQQNMQQLLDRARP